MLFMVTSLKPSGRPPAATDKGLPQKTSEWPKLAVSVRPIVRSTLNAIAAVEQRPGWQIVEEGIMRYLDQMPADAKRLVDGIVKRVQER